MKRSAKAVWNGTGKEGKGHLSTDSGVLDNTPYSFKARFEDEKGTNPEELVAAAHGGCFAMKLSVNLTEAGYTPDTLTVTCQITFEDGKIKESHLVLEAIVPEIEKAEFDELVTDAKKNCPISQLLNTEITIESTLK